MERSTDNQQHWQQIAELPANTLRYTDYGLLRHTAYWYRLTAYNASTSQAQTLQTETGMDALTEDEGTGSGAAHSRITYDYDRLNRLTEANYDNGQFFHYTYDANGNRLSETTAAGSVTSDYDAANRLTIVGGVPYTWDDNGNLTEDGQYAYSYDHANRLTKIEQNGTTVSTYGYRCNGLSSDAWGVTGCESDRVSQTVNGVTTNYVLDQAAGLTQVLSDGTNTYLYGNGRIGQFTASDSAYFLTDALGSVRQLTNGAGVITVTKSYEPYGEVLSSAGSGVSIYGFDGEQFDPATGLIYLRARYYASGRFLTRDTWLGDDRTPMSYNAWLFGYSNPVNLTDPSGHDPWWCDNPERYPTEDDRQKCYGNYLPSHPKVNLVLLCGTDMEQNACQGNYYEHYKGEQPLTPAKNWAVSKGYTYEYYGTKGLIDTASAESGAKPIAEGMGRQSHLWGTKHIVIGFSGGATYSTLVSLKAKQQDADILLVIQIDSQMNGTTNTGSNYRDLAEKLKVPVYGCHSEAYKKGYERFDLQNKKDKNVGAVHSLK